MSEILLRCLLAKLPAGCWESFFERNGFHLAALPSRPDGWSAALMVVLLQGSAISNKDLKRRNRWVLSYRLTEARRWVR